MGKRRRRGPQVKYMQPDYRHRAPAAPPSPAGRIGRLSPSQAPERISRARLQREELDAELGLLVDHAVGLGIGWLQIAARLGVSRQAARQHYQRRHRGDARLGGNHAAWPATAGRCQASGGTPATGAARAFTGRPSPSWAVVNVESAADE